MALSVPEPLTGRPELALFGRSPNRGGAGREQNAAPAPTNAEIAYKLRQAADILAAQGADPFRVAAYRKAAESVLALARDLGTVVERGGRTALEAIPGIGVTIGGAIAEMLATGRWSFLEHLKGSTEPEKLFRSIPGLGPALARRVCETLQIHALEALEAAARTAGWKAFPALAAAPRRWSAPPSPRCSAESAARLRGEEELAVDLLLDVDREYRARGGAGELPKIAPRRFNPSGEAWLPVLHTIRDDWHFTVIYSNTARAHQLGRTSDWVVIFFHKDGWPEGQRTVVTETHGERRGYRVVRGREMEHPPDRLVG